MLFRSYKPVARFHGLGGARVEIYLIGFDQFNAAHCWGRARRSAGETVAAAAALFSRPIGGERRGQRVSRRI